MFATVPNPVVFDGMFHVKVHCAAAAPAPCVGGVYVKVKGKGEAMGNFRVPAGKTKTVTADPPFDPGHPKGPVDVRIESGEEPPVTVSRRLVTHTAPVVHSDEWPFKHVVHDKRGDSGNPLDLRKAEAHVRNGRLIMTWTCWNVVTPHNMSHDVANFHMVVYTRKPAGKSKYSAGVFYGSHGPSVFAGATLGPNDWGGRFYRPSRHSARLSAPLSRFGRHIRQLWLQPATYGYHPGEDQVNDMIHFRLRR